ncbi:MAG TPA: Hsp20/alpha crystallin family protein [Planctomycetota bacterium]
MPFDPVPNPFGPLQALRSLQAEFQRLLAEPGRGRSTHLAFALFQKEGSLLLRTPLPSVAAKDVSIEVDGNVLTLSGQYCAEPDEAAAIAHHVERPRGCFSRTLHLPFEVDPARVRARLERGVLEVELPHLQKCAPVKITVQPAGQG